MPPALQNLESIHSEVMAIIVSNTPEESKALRQTTKETKASFEAGIICLNVSSKGPPLPLTPLFYTQRFCSLRKVSLGAYSSHADFVRGLQALQHAQYLENLKLTCCRDYLVDGDLMHLLLLPALTALDLSICNKLSPQSLVILKTFPHLNCLALRFVDWLGD